MVTVKTFTFNLLEENTMIVSDESGKAVIIDPGCYDPSEKKEMDDYISNNNLSVELLLNTHCHFDHILGNDYVKEKYKVPLLIGEHEVPVLTAVKSYVSNYGFPAYREATADRLLKEGDTVQFGNTTFSVLFLPGHSPGHLGFYHAPQNLLISGDVLFRRSIGRTDLPGGNFNTLIDSIHRKVFALPDSTVVFPGHGSETTVGEEKKLNPFCALEQQSR